MAVDSAAERMAVAGVPFMVTGTNCYPGTAATGAGRAAIAWNFVNGVAPPPGGGGGIIGLVACGTLLGSVAGGDPQCSSNGNWLS